MFILNISVYICITCVNQCFKLYVSLKAYRVKLPTAATSGAYPSGVHTFIPGVYRSLCCSMCIFCVVFCCPLSVCPVFIWPFCFRFLIPIFGTFKLFIRKDTLISKTLDYFWQLCSILIFREYVGIDVVFWYQYFGIDVVFCGSQFVLRFTISNYRLHSCTFAFTCQASRGKNIKQTVSVPRLTCSITDAESVHIHKYQVREIADSL